MAPRLEGCQEHSLIAEQLPSLETLSLQGSYSTTSRLDMVDMSGCRKLKHVAISEVVARELIWDATGSFPCPLTLKLEEPYEDVADSYPEALMNQAAVAQQVDLWGRSDIDTGVHGMLGAFPLLRVLTLRWPMKWKPGVLDVSYGDDPDDYEPHADARNFLAWCMPAGEQPLTNLTEINITAWSMHDTVPGARQLPNLRELLICSSGLLEVGFQNPIATISALTSLHLFGQPLVPYGWDLRLVAASEALQARGLVLAAAATQPHGDSAQAQPSSSCIYLRAAGTRELSMGELSNKADQILECRCGACSDCLQRAGCIGR